jgi:antitoxin (DNA-binding transcriptional repressor) of toxin-antitoxin stability system
MRNKVNFNGHQMTGWKPVLRIGDNSNHAKKEAPRRQAAIIPAKKPPNYRENGPSTFGKPQKSSKSTGKARRKKSATPENPGQNGTFPAANNRRKCKKMHKKSCIPFSPSPRRIDGGG